MIIKKTWIVQKGGYAAVRAVRYHYTGWFLFGLLPIYLVRVTTA